MSAMRVKRAVAIGASAGGVEALRRLFTALPTGLPAPMFVVLHISPAGRSLLADIIGRTTIAPVVAAEDGMPVRDDTIYVAPPDRHLIVEDGHVRLTRQPRENGHRPAIDVTFRSVAAAYGPGTIGVVLSGNQDDGSAGLREVKERGGLAFVQDPDEALYNAMPINALEAVTADAVLPIDQLARRLSDLLSTPVPPENQNFPAAGNDPPDCPPQTTPQMTRPSGPEAGEATGATIGSRFTCPDCGGVLFESIENGVERFRCSIGHVYSAESLDGEQERALEIAMWEAVRLLQDRGIMLRRLAASARGRGHEVTARGFERRAEDLLTRSEAIRRVVEQPGPAGPMEQRGAEPAQERPGAPAGERGGEPAQQRRVQPAQEHGG